MEGYCMKDLIKLGQQIYLLTVIEKTFILRPDKRKNITIKHSASVCKCDCGNITQPLLDSNLKHNNPKSCGCLHRNKVTKHGLAKHPAYNSWIAMKRRCLNKNYSGYVNYGGRGITFDPTWNTFKGFWNDMNDGWYEGATLERIDVNNNYTKQNCKWATMKEQQNNRRNNILFLYKNNKYTALEIAKMFNKSKHYAFKHPELFQKINLY